MIQNAILRQIRETLFCPETGLIYDYVTSRDPARRFAHLPCRAEVEANLPNPCGWGTGMEDCAINAGTLLDTLWRIGGDPLWAAHLVDGLERCITLHGRDGFVARGFSVRAPEMCYSNSSRDQLTLAVYGLWRVLRFFPAVPDSTREKAAGLLRLIAADCRAHVTRENHFNLLRLDGREALVSKMWECDDHEALRLPMVYAAAFAATGEREWFEEAKRFLAPGIEQSCRMRNRDSWWDLPIAQMQFSLLLLRECGFFPEAEAKLDQLLAGTGVFGVEHLAATLSEAEQFPGTWGTLNENWRRCRFSLHQDSISDNGFCVAWQGSLYATPVFPLSYLVPNTLLRRLGCSLAIMAAGHQVLPDELRHRLEKVLSKIDFSRCGGDGTVKLLHGLVTAKVSCNTEDMFIKERMHHEELSAACFGANL